ncbi:MAG TPA: hypothetical protein VFD70_26725 [Anaerolineae bacterium]|nr:hypothetical protein [Anaerolineae bacterium]
MDTISSPTELERLEWTASQSYFAYGVRFGLRTNTEEGLSLAQPHLPLGWQETIADEVELLYSLHLAPPNKYSDTAPNHLLYADSTLIARSDDAAQVLQTFKEHAQLATILRAQDRLFVHAGVVGWNGRAILLPGRSLSGKTTLVQALIQAGATYYSDEFAVLDRRGWVHPYALPLSIRSHNTPPTKTPIEQLGGQCGIAPLPVGLIAVTQYQRRAHWNPRVLSPARALLALMENTVAARREPEYTLPILRETVLHAKIVEGKRGEARHIAPTLLDLASA